MIEKILENFIEPLPEESLKKFITGPSKRIRSNLAELYLKAFGCNITNDVQIIMASAEIIHNASLLHDDVLDNADFRRGETPICKKYTPKISILSGDYLVSFAITKLLEIGNTEILKIFQKCTENMALAEIKQYFLRNKMPDKDTYIEICKGKTGALFSAILESVAIVSNIPTKTAKEFGMIFGIVFQIKNDLKIESVKQDRANGIYTATDILGIEKTKLLLDNLREEAINLIKDCPNNEFKERLLGLL